MQAVQEVENNAAFNRQFLPHPAFSTDPIPVAGMRRALPEPYGEERLTKFHQMWTSPNIRSVLPGSFCRYRAIDVGADGTNPPSASLEDCRIMDLATGAQLARRLLS
jgi:hypothetical protein